MSLDTVVIGAGQAGLAAAWQLARKGLSYRILEASEHVGGSWRNYYDSLTLFSPAQYSSLRGLPFPGDPERYPRRDEVVRYLEDYAEPGTFRWRPAGASSLRAVSTEAFTWSWRTAR